MIKIILFYLSLCAPLLTISIGWDKKNQIWTYALIALLFDLFISVFLKTLMKTNQEWAGNIFLLIDFIMVSWYYKKYIFKSAVLFYSITGSLVVFFIINTMMHSWHVFNLFAASFFCLSYIIYAVAGFYQIMKVQEMVFLHQSSFFWTNVAFLIYASGNFMLFLSKDFLMETDRPFFVQLWSVIFLSLNISKHVFLAIGISKNKLVHAQ